MGLRVESPGVEGLKGDRMSRVWWGLRMGVLGGGGQHGGWDLVGVDLVCADLVCVDLV